MLVGFVSRCAGCLVVAIWFVLACASAPASAGVPLLFQPREDPSRALEAVDSSSGAAHVLSRGSARDARIAANSRGDAVAAWLQGHGERPAVQVALRDGRTGRWRHATSLTRAENIYGVVAAIDAAGRVLVAWLAEDGAAVRVVSGRVGRGLDRARYALRPRFLTIAASVQVAFGPTGGVVLWHRSIGGTSQSEDIVARDVAPSGSLGRLTVLSGATAFVGDPVLAADPQGGIVAAWRSKLGVVAARRVNGPWSAVVPIGPADINDVPLAAAINATGDAAVAWLTPGVGDIRLARATAAAGFQPPVSFGPSSRLPFDLHAVSLAIDGRGRTALINHRANGTLIAHIADRHRPLPGPAVALRHATRFTDVARGDPTLRAQRSGFAVSWQVSDRHNVNLRLRTIAPGRLRTIAQRRLVIRQAPRGACFPRGITVLRRSSQAVIVENPRTRSRGACLFANGTMLDVPYDVPVRTIVLSGSFAAWPEAGCETEGCFTDLHVINLKDPRERRSRSILLQDDGVIDSTIRRDGSVAVLTCLGGSGGCESFNPPDQLLLVGPYDDKPRTLAPATRISPGSIGFSDTHVYWQANAQHRSARAPIQR